MSRPEVGGPARGGLNGGAPPAAGTPPGPRFAFFARLHVPGRPLVLVNAWDVLSALALAAAGHPAIGTTSLGITAAAGLPDGAGAGRRLTVELAGTLAARLDQPVTVDLEDGYNSEPAAIAELVADLGACGVAGVNLEDRGRTAAEHAAVVAAVRSAVPGVFLNARTEVFWSGSRQLSEALERCRAYRDAGAHGLFVPGLGDPGALEQVAALGLPLNALWQPGVDLAGCGVARISTGSLLYRRALAAALEAANSASGFAGATSEAVSYERTQQLLAR